MDCASAASRPSRSTARSPPSSSFAYERDVADGAIRLLFVSPERLVQTDFYRVLQKIDVRTFAIDEAHCISHWGHDFRPDYRRLAILKERFPLASVHAYTATATQRVRQDIIAQLQLTDPAVLVGVFDRPNLTYRVVPRATTSSRSGGGRPPPARPVSSTASAAPTWTRSPARCWRRASRSCPTTPG
jgi:hypothetical protein